MENPVRPGHSLEPGHGAAWAHHPALPDRSGEDQPGRVRRGLRLGRRHLQELLDAPGGGRVPPAHTFPLRPHQSVRGEPAAVRPRGRLWGWIR